MSEIRAEDVGRATEYRPGAALAVLWTVRADEVHELLGWLAAKDPQLVVDTLEEMRAFNRERGVS